MELYLVGRRNTDADCHLLMLGWITVTHWLTTIWLLNIPASCSRCCERMLLLSSLLPSSSQTAATTCLYTCCLLLLFPVMFSFVVTFSPLKKGTTPFVLFFWTTVFDPLPFRTLCLKVEHNLLWCSVGTPNLWYGALDSILYSILTSSYARLYCWPEHGCWLTLDCLPISPLLCEAGGG